jgi:S1-C subfamily serine protease
MQFSSVIENAIVQVITHVATVNWNIPLHITANDYELRGSGFCVSLPLEGKPTNLIVTNAHCIHEATRINIKRRESSKSFKAIIVAVLYECDLAIILPVDSEEFWRDIKPLEIHRYAMPLKGSRVYVAGFPMGGSNISITEGIVSRIDILDYTQYSRGIVIQIDAPVNKGNSGGPVLASDGSLVGITVAKELESTDISGIGYIIPLMFLDFMIKSINHGSFKVKTPINDDSIGPIYNCFTRLCGLNIYIQNLNNDRIRATFVPDAHTGVLISSSGVSGIKPYDVLVSIEDCVINNNGYIRISDAIDDESLEVMYFKHLISLKLPGETIKLDLIRNNKLITLKVKLESSKTSMILFPNQLRYPTKPEWLVFMGIVFTPISYMLIHYNSKQNLSHLHRYSSTDLVMSMIHDTEYTEDFPPKFSVLYKINNTEITSIKDLAKILYITPKKSFMNKHLFITFKNTTDLAVFHKDDVKKNNDKINTELGFDKNYFYY